jgi:hypothetical protein
MSTAIAIPKIAFTMEDLCITTYRERTGDLGRIVHDPDTLLPIHNLTRILQRREVGLTRYPSRFICVFLRSIEDDFGWESSHSQLRVDSIAQRVAQEIKRKDREADGDAGINRHPGRALGKIHGSAAKHQTPGGLRLGDA